MAIVFILLGALAATLFSISKLGLDLPPVENSHSDVSREDMQIAA
jgi:hypothetical protein